MRSDNMETEGTNMQMNLLGLNISIDRAKASPQSYSTQKVARDGLEALRKAKDGHALMDQEIVQNETWYRSRHWEVFRGKQAVDRPEPVTAYLFNVIANKHADAMDNYPKPNFLPAERDDDMEAKKLSMAVPVILEKNGYRKVYSDSWWYKLKHGFVIKGVFWDAEKLNGIGDIRCSYIDKLNCTWDGETIEKSRNMFIYTEESTSALKEQFPDIEIGGQKVVQPLRYTETPENANSETTLLVDWYTLKLGPDGRDILQYRKLVGENLVYDSDADDERPESAVEGFYKHGKFPVVVDILFPIEGTSFGFGFIAIAKSPQMYIDKVDQLIVENALQSGRKRWFRKNNGAVNMAQFADWSQPFVDVEGSLDDANLREIETKPLDPFISAHRQFKVQELKDITANDVFNSGNGGKGVTAASAIYALQEAGNKVSRDMIAMSYEAYREEMNLIIELIRQMYNVTRSFRIDKPDGTYDFQDFNNEGMQAQPYPDQMGMTDQYRVPEFDIKVSAEKSNPYSTMLMNEMGQAMFGSGMFNPQMAEPALVALEMMHFEGKEKIAEMIQKNSMMYQQMQQMQQALVKLAGATGMLQPEGGAPNGQG